MIKFDKNRLRYKVLGRVALFSVIVQLILPAISYGQSGGASQSDYAGGVALDQYVNPFTGDFNYSINLMNVEGMPITLTYNGNVTMNQEASWVGLGWSLNVGSINREMRGLPDDFDGDKVRKEFSIKENEDGETWVESGLTQGLGAAYSFSVVGDDGPLSVGLSPSVELSFEKYKNAFSGEGRQFNAHGGIGIGGSFKTKNLNAGLGLNLSGGLSIGSRNGIGTSGSITASLGVGDNTSVNTSFNSLNISYGLSSVNSTRGAKSVYAITGLSPQIGGTTIGMSHVSDISFGTRTYTPFPSNSIITESSNLGVKVGGALPISATQKVSAYYLLNYNEMEMEILDKDEEIEAYGYLNIHKATNEDMQDYNREKTEKVSENMPMTHNSVLTYDIFRVNGSSGGFSFRAHRNDVGTIFNTKNVSANNATAENFSVFVGLSLTSTTGLALANTSVTYSNSDAETSTETNDYNTSQNESYSSLDFKNLTSGDVETYFFKTIGEKTKTRDLLYDQYGGTEPTMVLLENSGTSIGVTDALLSYDINNNATTSIAPANNYYGKKAIRNTVYNTLSANEASQIGFETSIYSYPELDNLSSSIPVNNTPTSISRLESSTDPVEGHRPHHISEINIDQPGGARSYYSTPVYSLFEKQVVFSADPSGINSTKHQVSYSGNDNTSSNAEGREHLYQAKTIPSYATSFLLRGMASSDYQDRTGDGFTEDDFGSYVKVNHTRVYDITDPFYWQTPVASTSSMANLIEDIKTLDDDDKGSYTFGAKELWYVQSVEGKNFVAYFYLEDRYDMYSVEDDETGDIDSSKPAKLLKKIELYNKEDIAQNGVNATPIKTVELDYDYSLCQSYDMNPGISWDKYGNGGNYNQGGKLTLLGVYVSYGDSEKGKESPYTFEYNGNNYNYSPVRVDRWGVYRTGGVDVDYPYAEQNVSSRDDAVAAWSMTTINLPTGGEMTVEYESDDYGYVQNRKAMQMFTIKGFGFEYELEDYLDNGGTPPSFTSHLFRSSSDKRKPREVLYIDIPSSITTNQAFYDAYLKDIYEKYNRNLFYQAHVETQNGSGDYELISGFCKISGATNSFGIVPSLNIGYIYLEMENVDEEATVSYDAHPMMKDGWQYFRNEANRIIFPDGVGNSAGLDFQAFINGLNKAMNEQEYVWKVQTGKGYVRLMNPNGAKLGGGNRVHKITFKDNWNSMTSQTSHEYGVEYIYNDDNGVSYGVAEFEPTLGNEENPFRQPKLYTVVNKKHPDDFYHMMLPYGEMNFPAPSIGYSKVKVKSIDYTDVTQNVTGYSEYEYYTSKQYPIISRATNLQKILIEPDNKPSLASIIGQQITHNLLGFSQGFSVELNDMHGKVKRVSSYGGNNNLISRSEYVYKDPGEKCLTLNAGVFDSEENSLSQEVQLLGQEIDIVNDLIFTSHETQYSNLVVGVAFVGTNSSALPLPVFMATDRTVIEEYVINSFNKTIHNYAILESVKHTYLGSTAVTTNVAYDEETGATIVTSSNNQYEEDIYSVSVPAYWIESKLGQAYYNYNNTTDVVNIQTGGWLTHSNFVTGDELMITHQNGSLSRAWVLEVDDQSNLARIIDRDGTPYSSETGVRAKVIHSGFANKQFASISSLVTLGDPIDDLYAPQNVLASSAVEFSEDWTTPCELPAGVSTPTYGSDDIQVGDVVNPFVLGLLGNWRVIRSFAYQGERDNNTLNPVVEEDLRYAGVYDSYTPYYELLPNLTDWVPITNASHSGYNSGETAPWISGGVLSNVNKNGVPVGSQDILGRNSGAIYGYNNNTLNVPVALATNAKPGDIGFDGFEDYNYLDAANTVTYGHFDFKNSVTTQLTDEEAHTGRYSLKLLPGENIGNSRNLEGSLVCGDPYTTSGYEIQECQCDEGFNPSDGDYIFSAWVKQDAANVDAYEDLQVAVITGLNGGSFNTSYYTMTGENSTIDGWKRLEFEFTIPSGNDYINIYLSNTGGSNLPVYVDDIRIHPFNSTMITSVYDPVSLRKWADLDDYNFATFYLYDNQGKLVRINQETAEGIKTITESRSSIIKQ